MLATLLASATLMWLGAVVGAAGRGRQAGVQLALSCAEVGLVAFAIWWPVQALAAHPPAGLAAQAAAVALAVMLAGSARAAAESAQRWLPATFAVAGAATWGLALVYVWMVVPGTFAGLGVLAPWATGLATALLASALVVLLLGVDGARGQALRAGAALTAAPLVALAPLAAGAGVTGIEPGAGVVPQNVAVSVLVLVAGVLARVARLHAAPPAEEPGAAPEPGAMDALTRLPTRANFEERVAAQVARADAAKSRLALLFIDLDGFKPVNDTFGHGSGDIVLRQVGERLRSVSRGGDVLTRIGGDEFVLMVTGNPSQDAVAQVAKRLIEAISRPYDIGDREVVISCSVGIVLYPDHGAHTKLIARADAAMYEAKRSGGACYCFYTPAMDEDSHDKFDLVSDLRQAIENSEMELYYQPKIDALSGQVTAAEALLRWKHPRRGMVPPSVFIPLAERFGLIGALGNWVIEDACRQARVWREQGLRMRLAINLSPLQMRQDDIVERIKGALERHRIHPSLLTCEITESVAMEDTKATQETFRRLGAAGIHLSIDDFGTGYSSLSYLRRLPAEELKIDRSFVMDIESSADARSVVDAVVKLAHALGLRVVAEGVENERQREILTQMGCDEMQGYLFARPMSARALLLWAIDDRPATTAFRASLFGDTLALEGD